MIRYGVMPDILVSLHSPGWQSGHRLLRWPLQAERVRLLVSGFSVLETGEMELSLAFGKSIAGDRIVTTHAAGFLMCR